MTIDHEIQIESLRAELAAAKMTIAELRARAAGSNSDADSWLQRKAKAQAKALTRLQDRVVAQRFTLRTIESLGRGLSHDELARAREAESDTLVSV